MSCLEIVLNSPNWPINMYERKYVKWLVRYLTEFPLFFLPVSRCLSPPASIPPKLLDYAINFCAKRKSPFFHFIFRLYLHAYTSHHTYFCSMPFFGYWMKWHSMSGTWLGVYGELSLRFGGWINERINISRNANENAIRNAFDTLLIQMISRIYRHVQHIKNPPEIVNINIFGMLLCDCLHWIRNSNRIPSDKW